MLVLEDPSKGIELLMGKYKKMWWSVGFKINKEKMKILTKYVKTEDRIELMTKTGFKIGKQIKYFESFYFIN